eukprot:TRINITY_DN8076_c1_g1_i1.p1 TRINITY_DN8076_c1_g1~~TRINITY_DN8076_c1_g1_i1.p1  ORF type:complete len:100 (-),score=32.91 TRINITY_DN8076_c1_g1_i1:302-601(-)
MSGRMGRMGGIMTPKTPGQDQQLEELRRRVVALEGELQRKAEALILAELQLRDQRKGGAAGGGVKANGETISHNHHSNQSSTSTLDKNGGGIDDKTKGL